MSACSRWNWKLEMLAFEERGKPEFPQKNLSEQAKEKTTNKLNPHPKFGSLSAVITAPPLLP